MTNNTFYALKRLITTFNDSSFSETKAVEKNSNLYCTKALERIF